MNLGLGFGLSQFKMAPAEGGGAPRVRAFNAQDAA
jgi:hypothetical protein